jgi:hypothetical protein
MENLEINIKYPHEVPNLKNPIAYLIYVFFLNFIKILLRLFHFHPKTFLQTKFKERFLTLFMKCELWVTLGNMTSFHILIAPI